MMASTVLVSTKNSVRTLMLNRPERLNALNAALLEELRAALEAANSDKSIGAIVLTGSGSSFCSGDDLKEFDEQSSSPKHTHEFVESIQDITRQLVVGEKVVVGAIRGWAVGGGLEWVINCDLAVLSENTRCFFPELKWGMFPTGGVTAMLPKMIGLIKTRELMLLGETFDANDALAMGLAWKVVPDDKVLEIAHETAEKIAALPQTAVRDLKRVLNQVNIPDFEKTLNLETAATVEGILDPETKKRVGGFSNSR